MMIRFLTIFIACQLLAHQAVATDARNGRYSISLRDAETMLEEKITKQNIAEYTRVRLTVPASPILYQSKTPVNLAIHNARIDPARMAVQGEAYVLSENKTISVIPVSGRYEIMQNIPVLRQHTSNRDVIEPGDIDYKLFPERSLPKGTITNENQLIGLSPRGTVSAGRPLRSTELAKPIAIKKGAAISMRYSTANMTIQSIGQALENGSIGDMIRIKNTDSERAVTGRVVNNNMVELNPASSL
jgi:flagellar basal body P-ring formation protein FlgA